MEESPVCTVQRFLSKGSIDVRNATFKWLQTFSSSPPGGETLAVKKHHEDIRCCCGFAPHFHLLTLNYRCIEFLFNKTMSHQLLRLFNHLPLENWPTYSIFRLKRDVFVCTGDIGLSPFHKGAVDMSLPFLIPSPPPQYASCGQDRTQCATRRPQHKPENLRQRGDIEPSTTPRKGSPALASIKQLDSGNSEGRAWDTRFETDHSR